MAAATAAGPRTPRPHWRETVKHDANADLNVTPGATQNPHPLTQMLHGKSLDALVVSSGASD